MLQKEWEKNFRFRHEMAMFQYENSFKYLRTVVSDLDKERRIYPISGVSSQKNNTEKTYNCTDKFFNNL